MNLRGREIYENLQCRGGAGRGFYFSSQIFDYKAFTFDLRSLILKLLHLILDL